MIDIRSDTVTRPSAAMRQAMASAEVGDDVLDGDPTVSALEARIATLLGKDAALYFPTGSMANMTGLATLAEWGSEAMMDEDAHIIHGEMGGAVSLCGVQPRQVKVGAGRTVMNADDLRRAIRSPSKHDPRISAVCVENTHNGAGGKVTSLNDLRAIRALAEEHELPVHMDGARLWNASAATGTSLKDFAACADTVMMSFSKGLGCPVGAILAGTAHSMKRAHALRKRFGGGMRQSGILAASAIYALDNNVERLSTDHENARAFAEIIDGAGGARVVAPDTNIVMVDLPEGLGSDDVASRAQQRGLLVSEWNPTRIRAVAHLDADRDTMVRAAGILSEVLRAGSQG